VSIYDIDSIALSDAEVNGAAPQANEIPVTSPAIMVLGVTLVLVSLSVLVAVAVAITATARTKETPVALCCAVAFCTVKRCGIIPAIAFSKFYHVKPSTGHYLGETGNVVGCLSDSYCSNL
jgi:hypothetical protein